MGSIEKHETTGRPTDYTDELADEICRRISDGESLKKITDEPGMPVRSTVHLWLVKHKTFSDKYADARELQADVYADEMEEIARTEKDVQRARLIIDTRKWVASKLKPKKYGDKVDVTSGGEKVAPVLVKFVDGDSAADNRNTR